MGTDTDDLPCHIHADAEVQTTIKTYADVETQTYEAELPPGALVSECQLIQVEYV